MPRYFFDIKDGVEFPDVEGSEWPDLAAARVEAVRYSAEVLKEMPERFWNSEVWTMSVSDARRNVLFTLKFLAEQSDDEPQRSLPEDGRKPRPPRAEGTAGSRLQ